MEDHDSYIYSLTLVPPTGELASSGEDRTARIWSGNYRCYNYNALEDISLMLMYIITATGKLEQTITLPALSSMFRYRHMFLVIMFLNEIVDLHLSLVYVRDAMW